jgi:hypothetical protein
MNPKLIRNKLEAYQRDAKRSDKDDDAEQARKRAAEPLTAR